MSFDSKADHTRRAKSFRDYTIFQGDWSRPDGWNGNAGLVAPICGPFGEIVRRAVECTFEGGQGREILDDEGRPTGTYGYASRWWGLLATCNPALNVTQILAGKESPGRAALLYHEPIIISGIPGSTWEQLRMSSGLDSVMLRKQAISIACGSAGVGVILPERGRPPGLRAFAPHEVTFIPSPTNPLVAEVAIQWLASGAVIISDIRNPRFPVFGRWQSIEAWQNGHEPLTSAEGAYYPFRWNGDPRLHIVPYLSRQGSDSLQPGATSLSQFTLDTILMHTWLNHVVRWGSINRVVVTSAGGQRVEGLDQLSMDLRSVIHLSGGDSPAIEVIPHSMDAAEKLARFCRDALQNHLSMIDGDLSVKAETQDAKSGVAISLERAGVKAFAEKQARLQTPSDIATIQLLIAAHNWHVGIQALEANRVSAILDTIPQETPILDYPIQLSESEKASIDRAKRDRAQSLTVVGDRLGAWMVMADMDHTNTEARAKAYVMVEEITRQNVALVHMGFGLQPETIAQQANMAAGDDTVVYIPPSDVADTAASGLRLQAEFRSRWGGLNATQLLKRARSLQQQVPMMVGEVRALSAWLNANNQDAKGGSEGDGTWGDMADPSAEYIRYLSQGGDAAQVWCGTVLSEAGNNTFQQQSAS